ncbi:MAG: TonB-dependent hemoglobin/transferrin/lactoferrin family receptor [Pseudomonadota bacterium]
MRRAFVSATACLLASTAFAQEAAEGPLLLGEITLGSALRDDRAILDTPVSGSVRTREQLETRQANDFEDLIGDIPGVSIDGGPRGISQEPNIRGFRDEQIVLRFDGGRFNFGQAHRGRFFIDPDLVQRVEVVRGGGSTLFGSGALGGVLSFETVDAADLLDPGDTFGGQVRLGYASNGEIGKASLALYGDTGVIDYLGFIGARDFGADLDSGNGDTIRNSQIDVVNGLLKLGIEPTEDQRFEVIISDYADEGTTPANSSGASGGRTDVDRDADVTSYRLSWNYAPTGSDLLDLKALIYGNHLDISEDRNSDGRADTTEYDTLGIDISNRSRFELGVPVSLVYGLEAFTDEQSGTRNGAARTQFPDAKADTVGFYAEATWELGARFDLITGLRHDSYRRDPDTAGLDTVDEDFTSPRIGFSFRPNETWQIYGNVARAFRAPSLSELYNDGTHFAGDGFGLGPGASFSGVNRFIPNPDLKPEESTQFELGARFRQQNVFREGDRLGFSANAYRADVKNYINQVVTFIDPATATPGPGGVVFDGTTRTSNVDAELYGFEAEADYDAGLWYASAGLSIGRGDESGSDGEPLGSIPQDRLTLGAGWRPTPDWEVGARATFAASQDRVPENGTESDSYQVLDLYVSWQPASGRFQNVRINFGIDNVTDEEYQIYPNGLSQPGRTFKIASTFRF